MELTVELVHFVKHCTTATGTTKHIGVQVTPVLCTSDWQLEMVVTARASVKNPAKISVQSPVHSPCFALTLVLCT